MTKLVADWLEIPSTVAVCNMLTQAGHQAWFVGGCVRNALLGQPVSDLDICTDARPEQVMDLASAAGLRSVPTGIDHGTVTVVSDGVPYEITTFRQDVETDGRRAVVAFADTIEADAHRRDFTFNALYCAPDGTISDPIGGIPDLQSRTVRFIDDPAQRIKEDYLRILRFFRFSAWYSDPDNGIEAEGLAACAEHADGLETLSKERIGAEMIKLLSAPDPAPAVAAMAASGVLMRILPGAGAHLLAVLVHVEQAAGLHPEPIRRLAALGGQDVGEALRLSNTQAKRLMLLSDQMALETPPTELGYRLGRDAGNDVLALRAALMGREIPNERIEQVAFGSAQTFPLTANDLMPDFAGPALGQALRQAEHEWIVSGFSMTKQALVEASKKRG